MIARTQPGMVDLYASAAPVLVAVLAVIVILRLYQVLLRGAGAGVVPPPRRRRVRRSYPRVGRHRDVRAAGPHARPRGHHGVVHRHGQGGRGPQRSRRVVAGRPAPTWRSSAPWAQNAAASLISPSAVASMAAGPGRQAAASVLVVPLSVDGGAVVTGLFVDPASYAALVASSTGVPPGQSRPAGRDRRQERRHPGAGVTAGGRRPRRPRRQRHLRPAGPARAAGPGRGRAPVHPGDARRRSVHRAAAVRASAPTTRPT